MPHTFTTATTALDRTQDTIDVLSAAPFLVGQNVYTKSLLFALDEIHIGQHAVSLESS